MPDLPKYKDSLLYKEHLSLRRECIHKSRFANWWDRVLFRIWHYENGRMWDGKPRTWLSRILDFYGYHRIVVFSPRWHRRVSFWRWLLTKADFAKKRYRLYRLRSIARTLRYERTSHA